MNPLTEQDILDLIKQDKDMMNILRCARSLDLPDWWISAGFVRNKVWDYLHDYKKPTPQTDVDIIYFEPSNLDEHIESLYQHFLHTYRPDIQWSVTNQARMHLEQGVKPFASSYESLATFVETATCIAVTIDYDDRLNLIAPYGIKDLVHLEVKPIPCPFEGMLTIYKKRFSEKRWKEKWPKLTIQYAD